MTTQQNINGLILINKPIHCTSNAILQRVKRFYRAKKAGHTGTLDPLATGMLPICLGEATKFCQYLLDADKCYQVTGLLGIKTTTADAMGEVIAQSSPFSISAETLADVLQQFTGPIQQIPSMYSALKHQGKPLYHYARQGKEIERAAREVTIKSLNLDAFDGVSMKLTVVCSKGTYIRNLVEDIGERLGIGAHVTQLHRCYTAGFEHEAVMTPEALEASDNPTVYLHSVDRMLQHFSALVLTPEEVLNLQQGRSVWHQPVETLTLLRGYDDEHHFIGLCEQQPSGEIKAKRLMQLSPKGLPSRD